MVRIRTLIPIGFFGWSAVTLYVATLPLTPATFSTFLYLTLGGYMLGLVGMTITFVRVGVVGRYLIGLLIWLGTMSVLSMAIAPRIG